MKILSNIQDIENLLQIDGGKFGVRSLDAAYDFCKRVATSHYENFPVGSILIPKKFRIYFFSVYTFARLADDIADEIDSNDTSHKIDLLNKLLKLTEEFRPAQSSLNNPMLWALYDTIKVKNLPKEPFQNLIKAFIMDSEFVMPQTMNDNISYCKYSANPVGELVLRIFDNYNSDTAPLSDAICTGLQLVNFWQDISVDIQKGRVYIPKENLLKYNLDEKIIFNDPPKPKLDACLQEIYDNTEKFFIFGKDLVKFLENKRLKFEIALTVQGGSLVLEKVRSLGTDIVRERPQIKKTDFLRIVTKLIF